jgi:tetratricopeptide (TPR) repeat protein
MMGIIEPPEQQLEWNQKALQLAEKSADPRAQRWRGSLYNNIGWTYHDSGQYDKALDMFEKALQWREQQGEKRAIQIARWCVGRALRSLNRIDEALKIQENLLAEYQQSGEAGGYVYEELGECLLALGRRNAAKYFALAYTELSKDDWLVEKEPARLERLRELAQARQTK